MSTAPYLETRISESEEAQRLAAAVTLVVETVGVPVSADTSRGGPARAALDAGARVINDVTGLAGDERLARVIARSGAGLILMVSERAPVQGSDSDDPVDTVSRLLRAGIARARAAEIPDEDIVIDPGVGFFRHGGMPWYEWDCAVLAGLERFRTFRRPICVGVSRKSFIGALAGQDDPGYRLPGSLAATAVAVLGGAHLIRTHDVAETVQAVRIAAAVRRGRSTRRA
jgi:dihydropteroate synthase